jgi:hypothetical protein
MMRHSSHPQDENKDPIDKTTTVINGTEIIFEIKTAEPGTPLDERLRQNKPEPYSTCYRT